jgi:hypothetical protein
MMKNILRAGALLLAFTLAPVVSANAHDHDRGHGHAHGRRHNRRTTLTHWDDRNPTPGIPRRVRRGRNWTPGTPRGAFTPTTFPTSEGRSLGRQIRHDNNGGGHGRGHGKH